MRLTEIWAILANQIHADMNRIKEVLEDKEIKQTWLAENSEKATTW